MQHTAGVVDVRATVAPRGARRVLGCITQLIFIFSAPPTPMQLTYEPPGILRRIYRIVGPAARNGLYLNARKTSRSLYLSINL